MSNPPNVLNLRVAHEFSETWIFFQATPDMLARDPDFVGPPERHEVIVPIRWTTDSGIEQRGEARIDELMALAPTEV